MLDLSKLPPSGLTKPAPAAGPSERTLLESASGVTGSVFTGAADRGARLLVKRYTERFATYLRTGGPTLARLRTLAGQPVVGLPALVEATDDTDGLVLVMRAIPGDSLEQDMAARPTPVDPALGRAAVRALALGLDQLHQHGLMHLDVRPASILFEAITGTASMIDLGHTVPILEDGSGPNGFPGSGFGGAAYTSMELLAGARPHPSDDLYALACVAYEMLAGQHPFGRRGAADAASFGLQPAPIAALDAEANATLLRALALDREARRVTLRELAQAMEGPTAAAAPSGMPAGLGAGSGASFGAGTNSGGGMGLGTTAGFGTTAGLGTTAGMGTTAGLGATAGAGSGLGPGAGAGLGSGFGKGLDAPPEGSSMIPPAMRASNLWRNDPPPRPAPEAPPGATPGAAAAPTPTPAPFAPRPQARPQPSQTPASQTPWRARTPTPDASVFRSAREARPEPGFPNGVTALGDDDPLPSPPLQPDPATWGRPGVDERADARRAEPPPRAAAPRIDPELGLREPPPAYDDARLRHDDTPPPARSRFLLGTLTGVVFGLLVAALAVALLAPDTFDRVRVALGLRAPAMSAPVVSAPSAPATSQSASGALAPAPSAPPPIAAAPATPPPAAVPTAPPVAAAPPPPGVAPPPPTGIRTPGAAPGATPAPAQAPRAVPPVAAAPPAAAAPAVAGATTPRPRSDIAPERPAAYYEALRGCPSCSCADLREKRFVRAQPLDWEEASYLINVCERGS